MTYETRQAGEQAPARRIPTWMRAERRRAEVELSESPEMPTNTERSPRFSSLFYGVEDPRDATPYPTPPPSGSPTRSREQHPAATQRGFSALSFPATSFSSSRDLVPIATADTMASSAVADSAPAVAPAPSVMTYCHTPITTDVHASDNLSTAQTLAMPPDHDRHSKFFDQGPNTRAEPYQPVSPLPHNEHDPTSFPHVVFGSDKHHLRQVWLGNKDRTVDWKPMGRTHIDEAEKGCYYYKDKEGKFWIGQVDRPKFKGFAYELTDVEAGRIEKEHNSPWKLASKVLKTLQMKTQKPRLWVKTKLAGCVSMSMHSLSSMFRSGGIDTATGEEYDMSVLRGDRHSITHV